LRVEATGGLVQKQHLGRAQQRLRKAQALAHALGVLAHRTLARMGQTHPIKCWLALRQGGALELGKKTQGFEAAQVVIEHHVLGQVAQVAARSPKTASAN
jgi:hypothetical protein